MLNSTYHFFKDTLCLHFAFLNGSHLKSLLFFLLVLIFLLIPMMFIAGVRIWHFLLLILRSVGLLELDGDFLEMTTYHGIAVGFIAMSLRVPAGNREKGGGLDGVKSGALIVSTYLVQALLGFADAGFAPFQERFAQRDLLAGRAVTLSDGTHGSAHGVAEDGALLVHTARGMQVITSAEVSVRPSAAARPA